MNVMKEVGKKIRSLRAERTIGKVVTQEDLAKASGISVSFLSMIERGERAPHLETLSRMADALEVPMAEFFRFDSNPDSLDPLYKPLIEYCRKQTMTRKDVDKLQAVARAMFM